MPLLPFNVVLTKNKDKDENRAKRKIEADF